MAFLWSFNWDCIWERRFKNGSGFSGIASATASAGKRSLCTYHRRFHERSLRYDIRILDEEYLV